MLPEQLSAFLPKISRCFILHTVRHGFWMEFEPLALQDLFCPHQEGHTVVVVEMLELKG